MNEQILLKIAGMIFISTTVLFFLIKNMIEHSIVLFILAISNFFESAKLLTHDEIQEAIERADRALGKKK